jgi:hypothetical protein
MISGRSSVGTSITCKPIGSTPNRRLQRKTLEPEVGY